MDERRQLAPEVIVAFLHRHLEQIPQDSRNRYARRVEAMGAKAIADEIARAMQRAGWVVTVPERDPQTAQIAYNRTVTTGLRRV